jgi:hypothetical protein
MKGLAAGYEEGTVTFKGDSRLELRLSPLKVTVTGGIMNDWQPGRST